MPRTTSSGGNSALSRSSSGGSTWNGGLGGVVVPHGGALFPAEGTGGLPRYDGMGGAQLQEPMLAMASVGSGCGRAKPRQRQGRYLVLNKVGDPALQGLGPAPGPLPRAREAVADGLAEGGIGWDISGLDSSQTLPADGTCAHTRGRALVTGSQGVGRSQASLVARAGADVRGRVGAVGGREGREAGAGEPGLLGERVGGGVGAGAVGGWAHALQQHRCDKEKARELEHEQRREAARKAAQQRLLDDPVGLTNTVMAQGEYVAPGAEQLARAVKAVREHFRASEVEGRVLKGWVNTVKARNSGLEAMRKFAVVTGGNRAVKASLERRGFGLVDTEVVKEAFHVKWTLAHADIDFAALLPCQMVNHFAQTSVELGAKVDRRRNLDRAIS